MLWISEGRKIDPIALRILFARTQLDLNDEIAKYGLDAVPGLYDAPKYDFWTRTPSGTEGYFVITALSTERMTYRLVNETLAGLKIFSIDQGRNEQVTFEVEDVEHIEAFGGFSIGPQAEAMQALSNDTTSLAR